MSVSFTCGSTVEADLIRNAVNRYRHVLTERGDDPRNYAPANAEGAGFGWDTVQRAAQDMSNGSVTHMSRRVAGAIRVALEDKADGTASPDARLLALKLAKRLRALMYEG
ncbi:hypothetical protein [Streptomyces sp. enrichment culture]|uniref:hypothetical protein n=1 Tax=Streptomyces sp. enrichment culture TaxID=1795815 RepID=UPI003F56E5FF